MKTRIEIDSGHGEAVAVGASPSLGNRPTPSQAASTRLDPNPSGRSLIVSFWPLYGLLFLIGTENFIVSPLLPSMAQDTGAEARALASVVTAYALVYACAAPAIAQVTDRIGPRWLITAGAFVFALGNLFFAGAHSLGMLQATRAITGLGGAAAGPAIWAYLAGTSAPHLRGRAIGFGMGSFASGQIVGIPLGGLATDLVGWRAVFTGIGVLMVPLVLAAWISSRAPLEAVDAVRAKAKVRPFAVWTRPQIALAFLVTFLFQAGNLGVYTYLGAMLSAKFQVSAGRIGVLGAIVGAGTLFGAVGGGKLCDYWQSKNYKRAYLAVGWSVLLGLSIFATCRSGSLSVTMGWLLLWFVTSGAFVTTLLGLVTSAAPAMKASAVSWNNSIMFAGAGSGVWLIGMGLKANVSLEFIGPWLGFAAALAALLLVHIEGTKSKEVRP
jgi:MFS transporter, DHA1 family, inner membrane transport protein